MLVVIKVGMPAQNFVLDTLAGEGVAFADVYVDRTFPHENAPTRKPGTGMLGKYMTGEYDLANSYVIGDRPTDVQLARNLGAKAIYVENPNFPLDEVERDVYKVNTWDEIYDILRLPDRQVSHRRTTKETDITIELNLDGTGEAEISTGLHFLDHMLEQIARHGSIDLKIEAKTKAPRSSRGFFFPSPKYREASFLCVPASSPHPASGSAG